MGEQRRYRRPQQHKRRPPQPVFPSENEIREQPSPIPDLQATAKPSGRQPKRKIKPRGRALNLAKKYDRIIVLEGGKLVGDGTHESLLKSCSGSAGLNARQKAG